MPKIEIAESTTSMYITNAGQGAAINRNHVSSLEIVGHCEVPREHGGSLGLGAQPSDPWWFAKITMTNGDVFYETAGVQSMVDPFDAMRRVSGYLLPSCG